MKISVRKHTLKTGILRVGKAVGVFHLAKLLNRRKLLILCYHGFELSDESSFRPSLFMRSETFAKRLELIRRHGLPVLPLDEALERLNDGTLPNNCICLTIDDGFRSTLVCAAPLLKQYRFPATVYVTSYYVAKGTPIFRLVVQYMVWKTSADRLDVTDQVWGPPEVADLTEPESRNNLAWHVIEYGEDNCDERMRESISEILGRRLGVDYDRIKECRMLTLLTPDEIRHLNHAGVDIQLHTHRHQLPTDDESAARREITENMRFLDEIVAHPLKHLCYPSGFWHARQWPWLRALGIESATTCDPGMNDAATPRLGLHRVLDHEQMSAIEFEAEVSGFLELARRALGRNKSSGSAH